MSNAAPVPAKTVDTIALAALAIAATPGLWSKGALELGDTPEMLTRVYCDDALGSMVADCTAPWAYGIKPEQKEANAAFIAAANPAAILALIEELDFYKMALEMPLPDPEGMKARVMNGVREIIGKEKLLKKLTADGVFKKPA